MNASGTIKLGTATALIGAALLLGAAAPAAPGGGAAEFDVARVYWELNDTAEDLGVHIFLDGEDWASVKIARPDGKSLFEVKGKGPYKELGLTELFFEGAEPALADVPLEEMLAYFPEGEYQLKGKTLDNKRIVGEATFTHAIPDGPDVSVAVGDGGSLVISWSAVTAPPPGFPVRPIAIVGYQVLFEDFEVTMPDGVYTCTVPPEYVLSLDPGEYEFEVLAIEASGNQSITEGSFEL